MADKYTVKETSVFRVSLDSGNQCVKETELHKNGKCIAFFNDRYSHHTDAQKVCDLLNETSRSQGKYK